MEALYEKIQQYLNMDEEISFQEFSDYYKQIIEHLGHHSESFNEENLWKALFIVENVMSNANARASEKKGSEAKKYKKMAERTQLWARNLVDRIYELGYTDEQINERFEAMLEEGPAKTEV